MTKETVTRRELKEMIQRVIKEQFGGSDSITIDIDSDLAQGRFELSNFSFTDTDEWGVPSFTADIKLNGKTITPRHLSLNEATSFKRKISAYLESKFSGLEFVTRDFDVIIMPKNSQVLVSMIKSLRQ